MRNLYKPNDLKFNDKNKPRIFSNTTILGMMSQSLLRVILQCKYREKDNASLGIKGKRNDL